MGDIESPPITADSQLQDGIALARQDRREEARAIFRGMIQRNPEHEQAWLWLAWVAESREDARRYLEEARILLPKSVRIAEALRWAADATGSPRRGGPCARRGALLARGWSPAPRSGGDRGGARRPSGRARPGTKAGVGSRRLPMLRASRGAWAPWLPAPHVAPTLTVLHVALARASCSCAATSWRMRRVIAEPSDAQPPPPPPPPPPAGRALARGRGRVARGLAGGARASSLRDLTARRASAASWLPSACSTP